MNITNKLAIAFAATALAAGAQAATLFSHDFGSVDQQTDTTIAGSFSAPAGAADVSFTLDGFNTLDGDNFYIDVFTLKVNGTDVFSGTWDLGGGGSSYIISGPSGATATLNGNQTVSVFVPISLIAGLNTVQFTYDSPDSFDGTSRAGFQGLGDEGWGLGQVAVTTSAVPEPGSIALMLAGLGVIGGLARRRTAKMLG